MEEALKTMESATLRFFLSVKMKGREPSGPGLGLTSIMRIN